MSSSAALDSALAAPPDERGRALLAIAEDQWFDRKSARISTKDLANAVIGMANADGGTLVVGLREGRVEGVNGHPGKVNEWQQASFDHIHPPAPIRCRLVECVNEAGEADNLLVVEVLPSDQVHANGRDDAFLRIGDENRQLRFEQRQELVYDKGQASYEATPVRLSAKRLDEDLLAQYAAAAGHHDPRRLLTARGLLTPQGRVTVAACLLFAPEPQALLPSAYLRVLRFRGTERGTGERQQLDSEDDLRFDGPIPLIIERARHALLRRVPGRRALGRNARFEKQPIIPEAAWLEGLVNALVHRSYSMAGDHVRIEVFDDRIEIESPGRFPGVIDGSDPYSMARFARNPRIARVCAELGFGQELGEGVRRMYDEMRLAGLPDPSYRQTSGSVRLVLSGAPLDSALRERLSKKGLELLDVFQHAQGHGLGTGALVEATGWSRPTVLRELNALAGQGLVERVGESKHDPLAFWRRV